MRDVRPQGEPIQINKVHAHVYAIDMLRLMRLINSVGDSVIPSRSASVTNTAKE